jgi:hypothetical protein
MRRSSTVNIERISHIQDHLTLVSGDLMDEVSLINVLRDTGPSEVYNLAAQSFVQTSWTQPVLTGRDHGARRHAHARRDPHRRPRDPLLPGQLLGDVRQGAHGAPDEDTRSTRAAPTAWPRSTATGSPSTTARATTCTRRRASSSTTSRRARPRVRHAQGHPRRGAHQGRPRHRAAPRQPRRPARLGLRRRLRARHVADAPARHARRLRRRHGRDPLGARAVRGGLLRGRSQLRGPRRDRPAFIRPAEVDLLVGDATKADERVLGWKCEVDFYGWSR